MGGINLGGLASGFESGMGSMESLRQKAMQIKQAQFDLDQQIPPALYVAVAEVLAWAYGLESDAAAGPAGATPATKPTEQH